MSFEESKGNPQEVPKEEQVKLILPTAEEIMAQVEEGLDERSAQEGFAGREYLQTTIDQVGAEHETVSKGILDKLPKGTKKAILGVLAGLSLFAASGSFSKAEAGDSFFHKAAKQVETGVIGQIRGGFDRGERTADDRQRMQSNWEQSQMNLALQDQQMARQMGWQRMQMEEQRRYQKEMMAEQREVRRQEMKERALQREVDRYAKAIAKNNADLGKEEMKHNKIMDEIEKKYPGRLETQRETREQSDEAQYGQIRKVKGSESPRSFGPSDREAL